MIIFGSENTESGSMKNYFKETALGLFLMIIFGLVLVYATPLLVIIPLLGFAWFLGKASKEMYKDHKKWAEYERLKNE